MLLGQVQVETGSNEITAIPKLLQLLNIKGCIITIDAIGCQQEIVAEVVEAEADYVIAVKANQPSLFQEAKQSLDQAPASKVSRFENEERGHGRQERRRYTSSRWSTIRRS